MQFLATLLLVVGIVATVGSIAYVIEERNVKGFFVTIIGILMMSLVPSVILNNPEHPHRCSDRAIVFLNEAKSQLGHEPSDFEYAKRIDQVIEELKLMNLPDGKKK